MEKQAPASRRTQKLPRLTAKTAAIPIAGDAPIIRLLRVHTDAIAGRHTARSVRDPVRPRRGRHGEVYEARDTKLDRDVAIKILPEAFAHDPERIDRGVRLQSRT